MKMGISSGDRAARSPRSLGSDPIEHGSINHDPIGPSARSAARKAKILAVDDNLVVAAILAITLKTSGHRVTSVFSGREAIERLRLETFDLVVLDLHLPDYSGFEILEIVREYNLCQETPIIVVSSSDETYDISRARQLGAAGYFAKVVAPEALPEKIERILTGRDITWIDDYHCVTDVLAPAPQQVPEDANLLSAANDGEAGQSPIPRTQTLASGARTYRGAHQSRRAIVR